MILDIPDGFNEIVLARALRASLAHQRARMRVLLDELARLRMEARDASAFRYHVRADFLSSFASRSSEDQLSPSKNISSRA